MPTSSNAVETLLAERERRWRCGQRLPSEQWLGQFAGLRSDPEAAVSLIYQEYCLRVEAGEKPSPAEYLERFPEYARRLKLQFKLRAAISSLAKIASSKRPPGKQRRSPFCVGRYELRKQLGQGESASTYKAVDRRRGTRTVVKILEVERSVRLEFVRGLRSRIRQLAAIRHANLQRVHGLGVCKGHPYAVMEYVRGVSLASWLDRQPLFKDMRRAAAVAGKVAGALAILHDAGLAHGRLEAEHILLTAGYEPILTCPRLADKDQPPATPSSDVYALGLILHRMITGHAPDAGPPMMHRPDIDPVLDAIVRQMTAANPAHRFSNGRFAAHALGAWLKRSAFR